MPTGVLGLGRGAFMGADIVHASVPGLEDVIVVVLMVEIQNAKRHFLVVCIAELLDRTAAFREASSEDNAPSFFVLGVDGAAVQRVFGAKAEPGGVRPRALVVLEADLDLLLGGREFPLVGALVQVAV